MRLETDSLPLVRPVRKLALDRDQSVSSADAGRHFIDPCRFSDEQKAAVIQTLSMYGIGDDESRRLFVGAVGYELPNHPVVFPEPPPEPAPAPTSEPPKPTGQAETLLRLIAQSGQELTSLLDKLPGDLKTSLLDTLTEHDELCRGYNERYLNQLQCEIARLVSACALGLFPGDDEAAAAPSEPTAAAEPCEPGQPTAFDEFSAGLLAALAPIFEECFEERPTANREGAFVTAIAAVAEAAELELRHDPVFLAQVLGETRN